MTHRFLVKFGCKAPAVQMLACNVRTGLLAAEGLHSRESQLVEMVSWFLGMKGMRKQHNLGYKRMSQVHFCKKWW